MKRTPNISDDPVDPAAPLPNPRHERMALEVVRGEDQTKAYVTAYPAAAKWKRASAKNEAYRIACRPEFQARVKFLQAQAADAAVADRREITEYLTRVMRARSGEFLTADGTADIEKLRQAGAELATISVEDGKYGRKIKFGKGDGIAAAALLCRINGFEKPQKLDLGGVVVEVVQHDDRRGKDGGGGNRP